METNWRDKVKGHFEGKEFEDDDSLGAAASELIEQLKGENSQLGEYKSKNDEANRKLIEILESEPSVADFLADIIKGASLPQALARNFDMEDFTPQDGEPDYDAWDQARNERSAKLAERKKTDEELTANKVESSKAFDQFRESKGLSEEELDTFVDKIDSFLGDIYKGKVTGEFLEAIFKATAFDTEVEAARNAGLVEGKNMAIEPKKVQAPKGDGLPRVTATGEMPEKPVKEATIFDRVSEKNKQRNRF